MGRTSAEAYLEESRSRIRFCLSLTLRRMGVESCLAVDESPDTAIVEYRGSFESSSKEEGFAVFERIRDFESSEGFKVGRLGYLYGGLLEEREIIA